MKDFKEFCSRTGYSNNEWGRLKWDEWLSNHGKKPEGRNYKEDCADSVKDTKHKKKKRKKPYLKVLHETMEDKRMNPYKFYIHCMLRKNRAFTQYGKVYKPICTEIYNKGYSVTYLKSYREFAEQIDMHHVTFIKYLKLMEEEKTIFIKETDNGIFIIHGKHFPDGDEVLFLELPMEECHCDI